jgi:predicted solute-binding protein
MDALLAEETRSDVKLDRAMLDRYLAMYANEDTRETPPDARRAVAELFRRAQEAKIFAGVGAPEFAP